MRNLHLVIVLLLVTCLMVPTSQVKSQDLEETISSALKFFGSTMGAGLYHSADVHGPLGLCLGVNGAIVTLPDEFKDLPFIDTDQITLGYVHANLGLGGNLEVTGRMLLLFDLFGNLTSAGNAATGTGKLFSVGVKYGLLQMPAMPKLALQAIGHFVTLPSDFEDFGTVRGGSVKLIASHSFAIFGVYVGGGIDYSEFKVKDSIISEGKKFDETGFFYNIGVQVNVLPFVTVNAGLNFGEYKSCDLGADISIR